MAVRLANDGHRARPEAVGPPDPKGRAPRRSAAAGSEQALVVTIQSACQNARQAGCSLPAITARKDTPPLESFNFP